MYRVQKAEMRGRDKQDDPRLFSPTTMQRKSIAAQALHNIRLISETLPAFFVAMKPGIALCCLYKYHTALVALRPMKSDIPANINPPSQGLRLNAATLLAADQAPLLLPDVG